MYHKTAASAKANGQKHQAAVAVNKQTESRVSVSHSQQLKQAAAPQVKADHPAGQGKQNKQENNRK